ncbi:nucleotide disphospho-sugar-binding domain-containing protein [Streptomyces sp. NPDC059679]|uniref:nucleotide disphospho-sugar-binding domain-containing protein n=1 Tax=Streptomyces sp. NPDC059679 TaxID=3346903 RepID=UPI0036B6AD0E
MRVLMMSTPVSSHFAPLVPLAWALRSAGHEVLVAGQPDVMGPARSAGLSAVSIGDWFHVDDLLLGGLPEGKRLVESLGRPASEQVAGAARMWMVHTKYLLPDYLDFARAYRPDLIVSDLLEYTAPILGGVLGVPVVHYRWGVDPYTRPARPAARLALQGVCERLGLDGLPDPTVLLDPCPPALQLPTAEQGTPIRYVPANGSGVMPDWLRDESIAEASSRPRRVAISMGLRTLVLNGVPHLRQVLRAFDGLPDVEAVATVEQEYREELGPVPDNVRIIGPTPLHLFLGSCAAVIHHGGAGTALTASAFGLPQLVLPQLACMFATGDRLATVGAGITLDDAARQDDPEVLRESLTTLLSEPGYAKAAGELRQDMERMPVPSRVVADLEQLAESQPV